MNVKFSSMASVGFVTNPQNLPLYISSTQLEMLLALKEPQ